MIKEFKKPDLNAPRCRESVHQILNKKFIESFIEKNPQHKGLTLADARKILNTFNGKLWEHAVNNRDGVELPESLGYIFIGTCFSAKKYNTDFGSSIKNDLRYRHRNFESDNFLAKIFYTNFSTKYKFEHRDLWLFKGIRDFKRSVSKVYPDKWKMYVQVDSSKHITKYLKGIKKRNWFIKNKETFVIDPLYNEFDLS